MNNALTKLIILSALVLNVCVAQTKRIQMPFGKFTLQVDTSQWRQSETDEVGVLEFNAVNGEGYARVITERIAMQTNALKDVVLSNIRRKVDGSCKITLEETRIVNGKRVLALQLDANWKSIPIRYYGYIYGGTSGTIQVWTFTGQSIFANNAERFTRFLNGLEISDQELPLPRSAVSVSPQKDSGLLLLDSVKMKLKYDPAQWKQRPTDEDGRISFALSAGDGYAMIITERIPIPTDLLPEIVLGNAQSVDPNARIVFQEKRRINGLEVWFVKIEAEVKGIPLIYSDYLFGGNNGTVQVITYTGKYLLGEYERDFVGFLNGLQAE
jgi:hypothetical protein